MGKAWGKHGESIGNALGKQGNYGRERIFLGREIGGPRTWCFGSIFWKISSRADMVKSIKAFLENLLRTEEYQGISRKLAQN